MIPTGTTESDTRPANPQQAIGDAATEPARPTGAVRRPSWGLLLIGTAVVVALLAVLNALSTPAPLGPPLPRVAKVPDFSLIERSGRTVTTADLRGTVWIADFIFTTCAGPCPELSLRMRSLQNDIAEYDGKVKLVSFSVDPEYDRPVILRTYAKRYDAQDDLWWFLTNDDEAAMHRLVQKGFLQAVTPGGGGTPIIHSTRFVLVDTEGYIRAWYDGLEASSKPLILRDVERLLSERTGP